MKSTLSVSGVVLWASVAALLIHNAWYAEWPASALRQPTTGAGLVLVLSGALAAGLTTFALRRRLVASLPLWPWLFNWYMVGFLSLLGGLVCYRALEVLDPDAFRPYIVQIKPTDAYFWFSILVALALDGAKSLVVSLAASTVLFLPLLLVRRSLHLTAPPLSATAGSQPTLWHDGLAIGCVVLALASCGFVAVALFGLYLCFATPNSRCFS